MNSDQLGRSSEFPNLGAIVGSSQQIELEIALAHHVGKRGQGQSSMNPSGQVYQKKTSWTRSSLSGGGELYHAAVSQSPDSVLFVHPGDRRIIEANTSAHRLFGYNHREFSGLTLYNLVCETCERVDWHLEQTLLHRHHRIGELSFQTRQGQRLSLEVCFSLVVYPDHPLICVVAREPMTDLPGTDGNPDPETSRPPLAQSSLKDHPISEFEPQICQLKNELEHQANVHASLLQRILCYEGMLKRITDTLRNSLDETDILRMAVMELAETFGANHCTIGFYSADRRTSAIAHEYPRNPRTAAAKQGRVIEITETYPEIYDQLLNGQIAQTCLVAQSDLPEQTVLACPILDHEGILGDVWLFRTGNASYDDLEVRFAAQVANQCAIAIRQTRLSCSAQSQIEAQEHINQLKDDFLSTVSHELRTPIATIKMAIQMLTLALGREGILPDPHKPSLVTNKIAHYLKILNNECNREINLITDLLDLQRLEAGSHRLNVQPIDLSFYLTRVLRLFKERAQQQKQAFIVEIDPQIPNVVSDPQSLERILTELLTNACKYTPAGETITVSAGATSSGATSRVFLRVSNSGVEVSSDQLERIFDKFYRIPNCDPHRHGGTGLGLALIKELVLRIGGQIQAASAAGQTHFTVELPAAMDSDITRSAYSVRPAG